MPQDKPCTVTEARLLKVAFEKELRDLISTHMEKFRSITGLPISDVEIEIERWFSIKVDADNPVVSLTAVRYDVQLTGEE